MRRVEEGQETMKVKRIPNKAGAVTTGGGSGSGCGIAAVMDRVDRVDRVGEMDEMMSEGNEATEAMVPTPMPVPMPTSMPARTVHVSLDDLLCFAASQGYLSVREIMEHWHVPAADAVYLVDRMEAAGICEALDEYMARGGMGPRMLKD
jgi:hypothetical protein